MHAHLRPFSVMAVLLLAACTGDQPEPPPAPRAADGCGALEAQRETTLAPAKVAEVAADEANVVLKLSSSSDSEQAVTVRAGGRTLLSVRLPAAPRDCYLGGKVFVHAFRLPPAPTTLEATANDDRAAQPLTPGEDTQWVTVLPQDGFPLDVKVWSDEPLFG